MSQVNYYPTKTDASEDILPLDPDLAEVLLAHRRRAAYVSDSDYLFANESGNPRWPESMLTDHIKPAAAKAGVGNIGWHTFRHTYSTLLHALGTKPAVQKKLLRHANIQTTLNVYPRAISEEKRKAASEVAHTLYEFVPAGKIKSAQPIEKAGGDDGFEPATSCVTDTPLTFRNSFHFNNSLQNTRFNLSDWLCTAVADPCQMHIRSLHFPLQSLRSLRFPEGALLRNNRSTDRGGCR